MRRGTTQTALTGLAIALLAVACGHADPATTSRPTSTPAPLVGPGRGPALPQPEATPATPSSSPSPFDQIPFAWPPGREARVAVYDRPRRDVFFYPGSGPGVGSVFTLNPGQYYYDDGRNVYVLDAWREEQIKLVDGHEVGGFAFGPAFDNNYHLYFLGQSDPRLARRGIGWAYVKDDAGASPSFEPTAYATLSSAPSVTAPPPVDLVLTLAKPRALIKINALAELHGGVTSINADGPNDAVVFTTGDGGLYLYTPPHPQVMALLADELVEGGFHATNCNIDPLWGRYVVWQDTCRRGLLVLDRWTGLLDPMPYARLVPGAIAASAPNFYDNDPYDVVFTVTLCDGTSRLVAYNLLTEVVADLTVLDLFAELTPRPPRP